jgi:hypothetical protein
MLTCLLRKPWFHTESNCSRNKNITPRNKNTAGIGGVFLCFLSRVKRGIPTIFDHFFIPSAARDHYNLRPFVYPERSEGSLQSSTIFYPEAERGIATIFEFSIPKRSEGSLQSSTIFFIPRYPYLCHPERSRSARDDAVEGSMYFLRSPPTTRNTVANLTRKMRAHTGWSRPSGLR